jgi:hypothetical protein
MTSLRWRETFVKEGGGGRERPSHHTVLSGDVQSFSSGHSAHFGLRATQMLRPK